MSRPIAADRAANARRKKPANKRTGCKPHDDVCLEHDLPLVCAHGCEEATPHACEGEVPTELVNGEWCFPQTEGPEPSAVITYTDEPSPETGDVGWCWWAHGSMGCAPTYEAARQAAEAEIKRRIRNRMAVM